MTALPLVRLHDTGLRERARLLGEHYDHQFPSTYLARPAARPTHPDSMRPATFTGAAGELAVGYWYPAADADPAPTPEEAGMARLPARRPAVEQALRRAALGGRPDPRVLQQFTALAVASESLEPGTTRPATGATYTRVTAPPRPRSGALAGLRWIRRTRLGDRLWVTVRRRVRG